MVGATITALVSAATCWSGSSRIETRTIIALGLTVVTLPTGTPSTWTSEPG